MAKLRAMCAAEAEAIKRAAAALQDVGSQIEIRDRNNIETRRMQEHLQRENALLERQNMDLMRSHGACAKALCTSDPPEQTPAMGLAWLLLPFFPTNGIPQAAVEVEDVMLEHKRKLAVQLFHTYDVDSNGVLDIEEFLRFMEEFDPRLRPEGAQQFFEVLGSGDGTITEEGFVKWIQIMFGESLPDDVFVEGMQEFLDAAQDRNTTLAEKRAHYTAHHTPQMAGGDLFGDRL